MPVKRISALSQVLKETAPTTSSEKPSDTTAVSQDTALPQSDTTVLPQNGDAAKQQRRTRKTDERDKVTYYLDPGQLDKLDELRTAYRKATGKRLSEQDFMRLVIDRLELQILLAGT